MVVYFRITYIQCISISFDVLNRQH